MMNRTIRNRLVMLVSAALLWGCAATQLHRDGLAEVERGNYESGVEKLTEAVARAPDNLTYKLDLTARREASIQRLISAADALRAAGQYDPAIASYRRVLTIAPGNQRALRGIDGVEADRRHATMVAEANKDFERKDYDAADTILRSVLNEDSGFVAATALAAKINVARGPMNVAPRLKTRNNAKVTLQFRDAPTKMVFEVLARQTGINFVLDKDVKSDSKTTIFVQEVPIEEAIDLVLDQNSLARQILSSNMVLIYPNTPAKQKDYEEQIVHTFYLTNAVPKDVESMLKSMLGAKNLFIDERTSVVVMRDTPDAVRMAEKLVASIDVPEPEVLIEVRGARDRSKQTAQSRNHPSRFVHGERKPRGSGCVDCDGRRLGAGSVGFEPPECEYHQCFVGQRHRQRAADRGRHQHPGESAHPRPQQGEGQDIDRQPRAGDHQQHGAPDQRHGEQQQRPVSRRGLDARSSAHGLSGRRCRDQTRHGSQLHHQHRGGCGHAGVYDRHAQRQYRCCG